MSKTDLDQLLKSIGKRVFVEYFHEFRDPHLSHQAVIDLLPHEFTFHSRSSRTSTSRRIFREGLEEEALSIIASSDHLEPETTSRARELLLQMRRPKPVGKNVRVSARPTSADANPMERNGPRLRKSTPTQLADRGGRPIPPRDISTDRSEAATSKLWLIDGSNVCRDWPRPNRPSI